jgi:aminoglycoside phosphotransferase (APT) family kinase protein
MTANGEPHAEAIEPAPVTAAALLDAVIETLYARHAADPEAASLARREYEDRRGKVHQDDELWEAWSAAFVEWYVVERVAPGESEPPAARTCRELAAAGDPRADVVRALVTSQRSLFEIRAIERGRVELLDLLGGALFNVDEQRALHGVEVGDVAELRLVGIAGEIQFGRTFLYHPKAARAAIVDKARAMLASGSSRRDVIDQIAQLRVQVTRYRHMPVARVYR